MTGQELRLTLLQLPNTKTIEVFGIKVKRIQMMLWEVEGVRSTLNGTIIRLNGIREGKDADIIKREIKASGHERRSKFTDPHAPK